MEVSRDFVAEIFALCSYLKKVDIIVYQLFPQQVLVVRQKVLFKS